MFDPPTNQLPCKRVLSSELPNVSQCIEENCGIFFRISFIIELFFPDVGSDCHICGFVCAIYSNVLIDNPNI